MTNHLHDDWGDDGGLGPSLDAYARARLGADPELTAIVRTRVLAEARARSRTSAAGGAPAGPRGRRRWTVLPRPVRGPVLAAAGLLLAAILAGGVLAGTAPGGPLYGARLWVEEQLLPAAPEARSDAQLERLDDRLDEALQGADRDDEAAVVAALDEYRRTVDEALAAAGADPATREHVAAQLARHVAVLEALAARLPERAAEAIQAAVDRTELRLHEILDEPPPGKPGPPGDPEARPTPKPKPEQPAATPRPTPKPKPEQPAATPKPVKSPPGKPDEPPAQERSAPGS